MLKEGGVGITVTQEGVRPEIARDLAGFKRQVGREFLGKEVEDLRMRHGRGYDPQGSRRGAGRPHAQSRRAGHEYATGDLKPGARYSV